MQKYYFEDFRQKEEKEILSEEISGAGGGCFPAGTFVRTRYGKTPIEKITAGSVVIAYDRFGEIDYGYVVEQHVHEANDVTGELLFFFHNEISLFPKGITSNHAIFDIVSNEHKEAKEFAVGSVVVSHDGKELQITKIEAQAITEKVYNLTVVPQHTFLVEAEDGHLIKAHNGGGGKGGGSARAAVEAPNTLQTVTTAKILEVISHGEIEGIVGGAKGVYFNNTPLQDSAGNWNFNNVTFAERKGTISQTYVPGFSEIEAEFTDIPGTELQNGIPFIKSILASDADAVRVTIRIMEGLWQQNTGNGDLNGYSVTYAISTKLSSEGTWNVALSQTIRDKTTSPAEIAHRIQRPAGTGNWDIKIERLSADDSAASAKSKIAVQRITKIIEQTLSYDKIAYAALIVPASSVGNSIPTRGYLVKGIKCQIPSNFDPILRTYSGGYWDGTFVSAWTDDTAWVLYDLITNAEYGLPSFLGFPLDVNKWEFFNASLYNNCVTYNSGTDTYSQTLISDGNGGTEVRFTCNLVINTQQDAWQLLQAVASNMHAIVYMNGNQISIIQDRPRTSRKIVNNTNVIDGMFSYASTELTTRNTAVNVTFNDPNDRYLPRTISEEDTAAINTYGYVVKDLVAYGCTRESQARREALYAIYTEQNQTDVVTFSMGLNIVDIGVGELVSVLDNDIAADVNEYLAGRVVSVTGNVVLLDREVTLVAGHTYHFGLTNLDYTDILDLVITSGSGTTNTLTLNSAPPTGDYANHEFFCFSSGFIEPKDFIVIGIKETNEKIYTISGVQYDANKYAFVDDNAVIPETSYSQLISTVLPQVSNITFNEVFFNDGITQNAYLDVTWDWDETHTIKDAVSFRVRWRRDNNNYVVANEIAVKSFRIESAIPGNYDIIIEAYNLQGKFSLPALGTYAYRTSAELSVLNEPLNFYVKSTTGTVFTDTHLPVTWAYDTLNDAKSDRLLNYLLEIVSLDGTTVLRTEEIPYDLTSKGGTYDYVLPNNITDYGSASRSIRMRLYSRDTTGRVSYPVDKTFTNPVPDAPVFTVLSGVNSVFINITPPVDGDVAGYIIWRRLHDISAWTPGEAEIVYDGPDTYVNIGVSTPGNYDYRVAAYDSFGKTGLNLATLQSSATLTAEVDKLAYVNMIFTPNNPVANSVSWNAFTVSLNGAAPVAVTAGNVAWTTGTIYIYFDKNTMDVGTTTDITIAVQKSQILATYQGGTDLKGGDGSAFINGSQVVAQSIGASQLVANTAIITQTAQLANAIISLAKIDSATIDALRIANELTSVNYNASRKEGFKLDAINNIIETYGKIKLGTQNVGVGTPTNTFVPGALTLNGNALLNNSIIKKQGSTTAYDEQGYSSQSYAGACACKFSFAQNNGAAAAGFSLSPSSAATLANITYAIEGRADGKLNIVNSGAVLVGADTSPVWTPESFTLTGNATIAGSTISKPSGTAAWDTQAYSTAGFAGDITVIAKAGQLSSYKMFGLNSDPTTNASYTSIDFTIYFRNDNIIEIYENDSSKGTYGAFTTADVFAIERRGTTIRYKKNGTTFYTSAAASSATLYFDSSLYSVGASITNIDMGMYSSTAEFQSYSVDDLFEIKYAGTSVEFYKNSTLLHTQTVSAGQTFFFDSSIYTQNAIIDQIKFGQYEVLTPDYGARMEISGDVIKIFDRNDTLRAQLGNLNG